MLSSKPIPTDERLIFALDIADKMSAKSMVATLGDSVKFYKLGLELLMSGDYFPLLEWLLANDKRVFADLKFFDVPETVARAVRGLSEWGVDFATVHGNDAMMQAAVAEKGDMGVLAVTVLTSLDRGDLDDLGFQCDAEALVLSRARRALAIGCDGVISSGLEVGRLRSELGDKLALICPGIRPVDNRSDDDQKRVVSVEQAFAFGADYIVVGRSIRDAPSPRWAAEDIQTTIAGLFPG